MRGGEKEGRGGNGGSEILSWGKKRGEQDEEPLNSVERSGTRKIPRDL